MESKMEMLKINYNAMVNVKLDDNGKAIYVKRYKSEPIVDKDGFSKFALWELMSIFGSNLKAGDSFTKDGCIYIRESDVKPSNTNESNEAFNIIQKGENIGFEANQNASDEEFAKGVANFLLANVK